MTDIQISRRAALMMGGLPVLLALPAQAQTAAAKAPEFPGQAISMQPFLRCRLRNRATCETSQDRRVLPPARALRLI